MPKYIFVQFYCTVFFLLNLNFRRMANITAVLPRERVLLSFIIKILPINYICIKQNNL